MDSVFLTDDDGRGDTQDRCLAQKQKQDSTGEPRSIGRAKSHSAASERHPASTTSHSRPTHHHDNLLSRQLAAPVASRGNTSDARGRRQPPPRRHKVGDTQDIGPAAIDDDTASPVCRRLCRCRRSTRVMSVPNRSIAGFFVDSDWSQTDSSDDENVDQCRHGRRGDGAGDRRSHSAERDAASEDWLEAQREIYRHHSRAELLTDHPSPRRTFHKSTSTAPPSKHYHHRAPVCTSAGRSIPAIKRNQVQQFQPKVVATTNATCVNQPTVSTIKSSQVSDRSAGFNNRIHTLSLAVSIIILLGGLVYFTWPSKPPELEPSDDLIDNAMQILGIF